MRTYSALPHLNGNLMAAVDLECTGTRFRYHEPVQIAVVPLNSDLRPLQGVRPFYTNIQPQHPERADRRATEVHGLDLNDLILHAPHPDKVADMLIEWFEKLDLPMDKCLVPLASNWAFEAGFLQAWLGEDLKNKIFHSHARDVMLTAIHINDRAIFAGYKAPFARVGLGSLCRKLGIINSKPHDAYCDCLAEAEVYRTMVLIDQFE
jgi:DNA polymerase III epsilon subunit-like protein